MEQVELTAQELQLLAAAAKQQGISIEQYVQTATSQLLAKINQPQPRH